MLNMLEAEINLQYIRAISILSVLGRDILIMYVNGTTNLIKSPYDEFRNLAMSILSLLSSWMLIRLVTSPISVFHLRNIYTSPLHLPMYSATTNHGMFAQSCLSICVHYCHPYSIFCNDIMLVAIV